jgi:hypothetical protein
MVRHLRQPYWQSAPQLTCSVERDICRVSSVLADTPLWCSLRFGRLQVVLLYDKIVKDVDQAGNSKSSG